MEPRTEDNRSRFQIDKLEPRIAPIGAAAGLENALEHASPHVDPEQVEFVVNNVILHNKWV